MGASLRGVRPTVKHSNPGSLNSGSLNSGSLNSGSLNSGTSSASRAMAWLLLLLFLAGQGYAQAHHALVDHVLRENGERVHFCASSHSACGHFCGHDHGAHAPRDGTSVDDENPEPELREGFGSGTLCSHCTVPTADELRRCLPRPRSPGFLRAPPSTRLPSPRAVPNDSWGVPIYRLAPKQSPPVPA